MSPVAYVMAGRNTFQVACSESSVKGVPVVKSGRRSRNRLYRNLGAGLVDPSKLAQQLQVHKQDDNFNLKFSRTGSFRLERQAA